MTHRRKKQARTIPLLERIDAERQRRELTQLQVARAAGVQQSDVSEILRGTRPYVALHTVDRLARAVGLKLDVVAA